MKGPCVITKFAPLLTFLQSKASLKKLNNSLNVRRSFCPTPRNTRNWKRTFPSLVRSFASIVANLCTCFWTWFLFCFLLQMKNLKVCVRRTDNMRLARRGCHPIRWGGEETVPRILKGWACHLFFENCLTTEVKFRSAISDNFLQHHNSLSNIYF